MSASCSSDPYGGCLTKDECDTAAISTDPVLDAKFDDEAIYLLKREQEWEAEQTFEELSNQNVQVDVEADDSPSDEADIEAGDRQNNSSSSRSSSRRQTEQQQQQPQTDRTCDWRDSAPWRTDRTNNSSSSSRSSIITTPFEDLTPTQQRRMRANHRKWRDPEFKNQLTKQRRARAFRKEARDLISALGDGSIPEEFEKRDPVYNPPAWHQTWPPLKKSRPNTEHVLPQTPKNSNKAKWGPKQPDFAPPSHLLGKLMPPPPPPKSNQPKPPAMPPPPPPSPRGSVAMAPPKATTESPEANMMEPVMMLQTLSTMNILVNSLTKRHDTTQPAST